MISLQKAIEGMDENMTRYTSAKKDPALFNISLALKTIAQHLYEIEDDVGRIKKQIGA
ncbi:MAG: hypothetical protein ABL936_18530 [Aestuariivirga sp.]